MKHYAICRFCDIINGNYRFIGVDEPISENDQFIAIASIGAMVQGWTLILPKKHQCSMQTLYGSTELSKLINSIISKLHHSDCTIVAFEHGANKNGSLTGCGIDHAHLHIVPLNKSLLKEMRSSNHNWIVSRASQIASTVGDNEYLFYTEFKDGKFWNDPVGHLHVLKNPESQYFRRLIAKQLGKNEFADYKIYPYLSNAKLTRNAFMLA